MKPGHIRMIFPIRRLRMLMPMLEQNAVLDHQLRFLFP
jgi:hypothetical protein